MILLRLRYQNLPVALSHLLLQNVRVGLLVDLETGLDETGYQNSPFWRGSLYLVVA
jgi:hypothetical protein